MGYALRGLDVSQRQEPLWWLSLMADARKNLTSLITLLGSSLAVLGVVHSEPWLALLGIACSAASATSALTSPRNQADAHSSGLNIDGLNVDSLHIANARRRLNKSLGVSRAFQVVIVDGADLHLAWQYDGYCRARSERTVEFSIDSENNVPFEELDCFAFDLQNDPGRLQQIRPILVGSDGLSKKISVPFLRPLAIEDRFSVLLNCKLPGCVTSGVQYYTSSLSFDQASVESASVHLIFVRTRPEWVRVYECVKNGHATPLSELRPFRDDGSTCEFVHMAQNVPGQSVRVYLYDMPAVQAEGPRTRHATCALNPLNPSATGV